MALFTTKTYFEWQVIAQTHFILIKSFYIVDGYSKTKGFSIFQYIWMSFDVRLRTIDPLFHTLISFIDLRDRIPFEFNFRLVLCVSSRGVDFSLIWSLVYHFDKFRWISRVASHDQNHRNSKYHTVICCSWMCSHI